MKRQAVGYVLQRYPALRTTFVRREIAALRSLGVDVQVISMREADRDSLLSDADAIASIDDTRYLSANPLALGTVAANLLWAIRRPRVTLRNVRLAFADPGKYGRWRRVRLALQVWRAAAVARELERRSASHVHAHFADGAATTALAASRLLRVPFSFTSHTSHDSPALKEKLAESVFIASISEYDRQRLINLGAPGSKVRLVRSGIPLAQFKLMPRSVLRNPLQVVSVGALIESKGHDMLIRACGQLINAGMKIKCRIVGDGPLRNDLQSLARQLGITEHVELAGALPQEATRSEIANGDVFVLACQRTVTGDTDGIPVAIMEAMALGRLVVSTRLSGIPELVLHEQTGLLAEPNSADSLADTLRTIPERSDVSSMVHRARTLIESEFEAAGQAMRLRSLFTSGPTHTRDEPIAPETCVASER